MYFLFSLIFFDLKSILSDISIATPALFLSLFHEHLFRPFFVKLFSIYLCLWIWFFWKKHKLGHIWVIFVCYFHSINLCLFTGEFDPLTFKLITNKERLTSVTVISFWHALYHSVPHFLYYCLLWCLVDLFLIVKCFNIILIF